MAGIMRSGMKVYGSKADVWAGRALMTKGKLRKKHLTISKSSHKPVSKKKQALGKKLARKYPPQLTKHPNFV